MTESGKAVFLSYAREDTEAAKRIADALRAFGVEVWFDQSELRGGDAWDQKIRTQIRTCALFLPIISQRTEERSEGYFRREWKLATDRMQDMGSGRTFIVPIVIDDTGETEADVPEEFRRIQWTRLPGGAATPEFAAQVKRLLEPKKPSLKPELPRPPTLPPQFRQATRAKAENKDQKLEGRKSGLPGWAWGAVTTVVVAAGVAFFALRPPEPAAPPVAVAVAPPASKAAPELPRDKSLAVLPFTNMSEDKESGYFADGDEFMSLLDLEGLLRALELQT